MIVKSQSVSIDSVISRFFFQISGIIKSLPMQESYHLFPSTASTASTTSVAALASLAGSSGNFVENGGNGGGGGGGILPPHYPPNTRCDKFGNFWKHLLQFLKTSFTVHFLTKSRIYEWWKYFEKKFINRLICNIVEQVVCCILQCFFL